MIPDGEFRQTERRGRVTRTARPPSGVKTSISISTDGISMRRVRADSAMTAPSSSVTLRRFRLGLNRGDHGVDRLGTDFGVFVCQSRLSDESGQLAQAG